MEHRIMIVGYSGSGKSTLAKKLGGRLSCEVMHLDCVHWLPGWIERDRAERNRMITQFLDTNRSWVIDGTYQSACLKRRLEEATQIIFLDFPRGICLFRVIRRYVQYRGKSRESMTTGCEERVSGEFFWWVLYRGRDKAHRKQFQKICTEYAPKVVVLRNPKEVRQFERRFESDGKAANDERPHGP